MMRNEKGAVAIEFVIVTLFILMPLLFGTIDLALAVHNKQVITNASREGARAGIAQSTTSEIETVVANYCTGRLIPDETTLPTTSVTGGGAFQNDITVTVTYEHNFMFAGVIGMNQVTMTGRTVMKMEPLPPSGS